MPYTLRHGGIFFFFNSFFLGLGFDFGELEAPTTSHKQHIGYWRMYGMDG